MGYTKLFSTITRSSIWDEDNITRIVWITMLAEKDRHHFVRGTTTYLALAARVSIEECVKALDKLSSPDPHSHTPDNDGARIKADRGGWLILNGEKYQKLLSYEERQEYNRQKQAEYRKRKKDVELNGRKAGARQSIREGFGK